MIDGFVLASKVFPGFTLSKMLKKDPFISTMADAVGCLYIPRGGTREEKDQILQEIKLRQEMIRSAHNDYPPIVIFPEGVCTNEDILMSFKKGAFVSEMAVTPMILKYSTGTVSLAWDVIDTLPLLILVMSWYFYTCEL